jgi:crotonobetainyl-CoA hydratase
LALGLLPPGRPARAAEGKEIGFVTEVVPQGKALEEAKRWAGMILECSPMAIKATKETVLTGLNTADLKTAFETKVPGIAKLMHSADHKEGPKAFAEKRKPVWQNE